jgi:cytochrome b561
VRSSPNPRTSPTSATPQLRDSETTTGIQIPRFSGIMQSLHWGTASLLLGSYPAAWMIGSIGGNANTVWLLMVHRSCGITVLLLTVLRLTLRRRRRIPPLPPKVPMFLRVTAKTSATTLYVLLFLQPLLGLIGSLLYGDRIVLFGIPLVQLPLPTNRALSRQIFQVHAWVAAALLAMIAIHISAALYHHFVRKDEVLVGMLPNTQRLSRTPEGQPDRGRHA